MQKSNYIVIVLSDIDTRELAVGLYCRNVWTQQTAITFFNITCN